MELTHSFTVPASVEDTWKTFMDLQLVGGCFPGGGHRGDRGRFSGTVKVKLGPADAVCRVRLLRGAGRPVAPGGDRGQGQGQAGTAARGATVTIRLTSEGDGATRADVTTDLTVTGKPAQFGGASCRTSDKLLQQFIGCIEDRLAPAGAGGRGAGCRGERRLPWPVRRRRPRRRPSSRPSSGRCPPCRRAPAEEGAAIDLGSTVGPVLLKTYGPRIAVGAVVLALVVWLVRRCRC